MANKIKYEPLEDATCFDFTDLLRKVKKEAEAGTARLNPDWLRGEIQSKLEAFELNGQKFSFGYKENKLVGDQWYVLCPSCRRMCRKLYLPDRYQDREQVYSCRQCHRLRNSSVLLHNSKQYTEIIRPMKRLESIKRMLVSRGMTPERAVPLMDEYERIETTLVESPAYRLWKFRQQHGSSGQG